MKLKDFTQMLLALESQGSIGSCEVFFQVDWDHELLVEGVGLESKDSAVIVVIK